MSTNLSPSAQSQTTPYQPITEAIADRLRAIIGDKYVIFGDDERLEPYSHDEIADPSYARMPECVVRPDNTTEIAAILRMANEEHFPVTPRGAGSGLSGGAVPLFGGVVLLCDRMNRVIDFDRDNLTITVEPGMVTNEINDLVADDGLFYAGYPMSVETCFIGGNVAENAGGGKAVKYGVTGRYVIGLEVVTPKGEIMQLGGKLIKDVAGLNLLSLMTGSEGTLGIFTKITLRLVPAPRASVDLLVLFPTMAEAIQLVPKLMSVGGVVPTAIEFMDKLSVQAACQYLNETIPYDKAGAMLLITCDGTSASQVETDYESIGNLCVKNNAIEVYVADNHTTSERIWRIRRNIAEAFKVQSPIQSLEDIVVPTASIPAMVEGIERIMAKYDVQIPCYGHAGDGNLHATPVINPTWSQAEWDRKLPSILNEMYLLTYELGGSITGEHGVGHKRIADMERFGDPVFLETMRAIKKALDPNLILNPGKIVTVE